MFPLFLQYPSRSYHNWGRPLPPHTLWARRSSWNSLGGVRPCSSSSPSSSPAYTPTSTRPFYGYGLAGLGGVVGGSLRIRGPRASSSPHHHIHHGPPDEEESLLSPPAAHCLHLTPPILPGQFGPRRDRRALSLEFPHLLQVPDQPHTALPAQHPYAQHRKKSFSGGMTGDCDGDRLHQDCNGKTPLSQLLLPSSRHQGEHTGRPHTSNQLRTDVFPQVNTRGKDREDMDDDIDYVSAVL